jgi:molecular chaperone GrpE
MSKHENKNQTTSENNEPVETSNDQAQLDFEALKQAAEDLKKEITDKNHRIASLEKEIKTINDDYVNKVTEKANEANTLLKTKITELTNKAQQELTVHKKYALEKQAVQLIDIVNQFAMALSYKPADPNIVKYQSGFQMFLTMFQNLLTELGIHEIPIKLGDEFNPEFMECIEFVDGHDSPDNKIAKVITKGYRLHDRLIKPATVNVIRKKN